VTYLLSEWAALNARGFVAFPGIISLQEPSYVFISQHVSGARVKTMRSGRWA